MGSYMEISLQAKKLGMLSMRACYRSVKGHPVIVGTVLFLIFLYRSFPFLFSVLLSASPVLVCTAVLLGTLLSFGQPNIPEIEKDEDKLSRDVVSVRAGVSGNDTFVVERERDASFVVERYDGGVGGLVDKSAEDTRLGQDRVDIKFENDVDSPDCVPLIDGNSREIRVEKMVVDEVERGFLEFEFEKKRGIVEEESGVEEEGMSSDGKVGENQYLLVRNMDDDEILAVEVGEFDGESVRAYKEDHLESAPLKGDDDNGVDNEEDDDDDDDDEDGSLYSDSDRAESSSPDASMADIIPMLDELHPLLDLEIPQPPHMSHDESDAGSEHSHRNDDGSGDSDAEVDNHGDEAEEDGVDENEDDEEEAHGDKEDESKSAIKWTEDDQKNLMDLGTSELERNQRLENLIARRRARKSFRLTAEKNLIDLESADLPFNVSPISTARQNPFDVPYDSYEQMGLPPIPGSAPSILLPRRNPFDLPYDSNEEKPDLKGDNFEQEFLTFHQKETLFRRHESFSLGPSGLGGSRHESKWKPFFVPERPSSEGMRYSSFQRQSSEVSESKLSSVPDTDSVSSVADTDEKKLSGQDFSKETELPSNIYEASDLVERGSQSPEDDDYEEMVQDEKRDFHIEEDEITLREVENHDEMEFEVSETQLAAAHVKLNTPTIHLKTEPVEEEGGSTSKSSRSSLSEVDDGIADMKNEGGSTSLVAGDDPIDEPFLPAQPLLEEEVQFTSEAVDDNQNKEPVYDSSPHAAETLLSLSSISSDTQVEMSEVIRSPTSVEVAASFVDREVEVHGASTELDSNSKVVAEDEVHDVPREIAESREIDVSKVALSEADQLNNDQSEIVMSESEPVHVAVYSGSLSSEIQVDQETEVHGASIEKDTYSKNEVHVVLQEITESREIDVSKVSSSEAGQENNDQSESVVSESEPVHVTFYPGSLSSEIQVDQEIEVHGASIEKDTYSMDEVHAASREITKSREIDVSMVASSEVGQEDNGQSESVVSESEPVHVTVYSDSLSSEIQIDQETKVHDASLEKDKVHDASLEKDTYSVDEVNVVSREITESRGIDVSKVASSEVGKEYNDQSESMVPESEIVHVSVYSGSLSSEIQLVEENKEQEERNNPNEHDSLRPLVDIPSSVDEPKDDKLHMVVVSDHVSSEDITMSSQQEEHVTTVVEHVSVFSNLSTSGIEPLDNWELVQEEIIHLDQHQVQSDSSSDITSVEDEMPKDRLVHSEMDDDVDTSSSDSKIQVESSTVSGAQSKVLASTHQHTLSDDSTLAVPEEAQPPPINEQVLVENEHEKEYLIDDEVAAQSDPDQFHSSSLDAKADASILQDSELKVDSSSSDDKCVPSEEKSPTILEKDLSLPDKIVVEPCDDDHDELHESTTVLEEIKGDVCDPLDTVSADTSKDYDSASLPVGSVEYVPLAHEVDMKNCILDQVADDSDTHVPKHFNYELEAHDGEAIIKEEVDEIKDFDEGLLLELDTVGDFRISELHDSDLILEEPNVGNTEHETFPSASTPKESSTELPVLEVRSFEDIDLAFKQLHEGADVEEVIVPSMVKEQLIMEESKSPREFISDFQVVEAQSLEDIHVALKQVSDGNVCELPTSSTSASEYAKVEVIKVESATQIKPDNKEPGGEEVTQVVSDDSKHESHETFEDSNTSTSKTEDKKSKDNLKRSDSSSNSSSSSSSSSSDSE